VRDREVRHQERLADVHGKVSDEEEGDVPVEAAVVTHGGRGERLLLDVIRDVSDDRRRDRGDDIERGAHPEHGAHPVGVGDGAAEERRDDESRRVRPNHERHVPRRARRF